MHQRENDRVDDNVYKIQIHRLNDSVNHRLTKMMMISIVLGFVLSTIFGPVSVHNSQAIESNFAPAPYEDPANGRNSNVYEPHVDEISSAEQEAFVQEIATYATQANEQWGIPASVIIGMAIQESGYGTTRIAYHANNLFGIKVWNTNPSNAWQLKGQPDEDGGAVPVTANHGQDQKVFDESQRRDNWYRDFHSYHEAVNYLTQDLLLNDRYVFALHNYADRVNNGTSLEEAAKQYVYEITEAGYNHQGGAYYRQVVGDIIDEWHLYQYDGSPQGTDHASTNGSGQNENHEEQEGQQNDQNENDQNAEQSDSDKNQGDTAKNEGDTAKNQGHGGEDHGEDEREGTDSNRSEEQHEEDGEDDVQSALDLTSLKIMNPLLAHMLEEQIPVIHPPLNDYLFIKMEKLDEPILLGAERKIDVHELLLHHRTEALIQYDHSTARQ